MRRDRRSLIPYGVLLLFPLLVWLGFIDFNGPIFFVPEAHSAGDAADQNTPGAREQARGGPILIPEKRTTLLSRAQRRGYASYQYYCAACHGKRGGGNGMNAKNLSVPPRRHNDAPYMANLSDAYLSGVIKAGGASQGLSPLMPPWGKVLSDGELLNLIAFIRILPEDQMMSSVEEHQKSTGMGDHHAGGAEVDDHQAVSTDDHHVTEADDHNGTEGDELHTAEADDHHEADPDDHQQTEPDDHHEEDPDDHHETEPDDPEADEHGAADRGDHHAN